MHATANGLGRDRLLDALAGWTGRIPAGETPPAPPRPQGVERNLVITQWEWGDLYATRTTRSRPTSATRRRYANGKIYGVDLANDRVLSVDPITHTADVLQCPRWADSKRHGASRTIVPPQPAASGRSAARPPRTAGPPASGKYQNPANPHNPMLDDRARVWITTQVAPEWERIYLRSVAMRPASRATTTIASLVGTTPGPANSSSRHVLWNAPPAVRRQGRAVAER